MLDECDTELILSDEELKTLPTGYVKLNRETGWKMLRSGKPTTALGYFHVAAAACHDDIATLAGRAKARQQINIFDRAIEDALKIIQLNDFNKDAIMLLAACQVGLGNFEQALVMFNCGLNKRGNRKEFVNGEKAIRAILENTVGNHAGPALARLETSIRKMGRKQKTHKVHESHHMKSNCLEELWQNPICKCTAEEFRRNEKIREIQDEELCEIHLGRMADDYKYFKLLANSKNDNTVKEIAERGFKAINHQLELSKNKRPMYYMQNQPYFTTIKKEKEKVMKIKYDIKDKEIHRMLRNMAFFRNKRETKNCVYEGNKIKRALEGLPNNKPLVKYTNYLETLCQLMGLIYMDELKLCNNLSFEENRQRIHHLLGFQPLFNEVWLDPNIQISGLPFFNALIWQNTYKEYINMAENNLEKSWLHYEVSRCYLIQKKWEHLVVEGKKSANCASVCNDLTWRINAMFLVVIGQCHLKNRADALEDLQDALQCALQLPNEETIKFLNEVKNVLQDKRDDEFYANVNKIIKKREKTIIRLQKDVIFKERAEDLLSRINFLSVERRLGLVPGLKPVDNKTCTNNKSIIRGATGGRLGLHPVTSHNYLQFSSAPKI